jgi:hypothetical protein
MMAADQKLQKQDNLEKGYKWIQWQGEGSIFGESSFRKSDQTDHESQLEMSLGPASNGDSSKSDTVSYTSSNPSIGTTSSVNRKSEKAQLEGLKDNIALNRLLFLDKHYPDDIRRYWESIPLPTGNIRSSSGR